MGQNRLQILPGGKRMVGFQDCETLFAGFQDCESLFARIAFAISSNVLVAELLPSVVMWLLCTIEMLAQISSVLLVFVCHLSYIMPAPHTTVLASHYSRFPLFESQGLDDWFTSVRLLCFHRIFISPVPTNNVSLPNVAFGVLLDATKWQVAQSATDLL
jgi:hypothetical protein